MNYFIPVIINLYQFPFGYSYETWRHCCHINCLSMLGQSCTHLHVRNPIRKQRYHVFLARKCNGSLFIKSVHFSIHPSAFTIIFLGITIQVFYVQIQNVHKTAEKKGYQKGYFDVLLHYSNISFFSTHFIERE